VNELLLLIFDFVNVVGIPSGNLFVGQPLLQVGFG
jgi:hypothetical protein